MIVVDASVAVKWFLDEPGSAQARELRRRFHLGDVELAAPDLLIYEVANALVCQRVHSPAEIAMSVDTLLSMELILSDPELDLMSRGVALADQRSAALYDAVYVALAEMLGGELATADRHQAAMAQPHARVRLIT